MSTQWPKEFRAEAFNGDGLVSIVMIDGRLFVHGDIVDKALSPSRARLISAAPDLLEALEHLVACSGPTGMSHISSADLSIARAAITKARGETT